MGDQDASADVANLAANKDAHDKRVVKEIQQRLAGLVRASNGLPRSGDGYELCNSFSAYAQLMNQQETRLQSLLTRCMAVSGCPVRPPRPGGDLDNYMDKIIRANDSLIERASVLMDELERAGRDEEVKVPKALVGAESTKRREGARSAKPLDSNIVTSSLASKLKAAHEEQIATRAVFVGPKPQKQFGLQPFIDNSRSVFKSKLHTKYHARSARQSGLNIMDEDGDRTLWVNDECESGNPYRVELDHFTPTEAQLTSSSPKKPCDIESTPLLVVSTLDELNEMCSVLNKVTEFAVDLEHHDSRTFLGLTCLLQISTREVDYIVDPFPIWQHLHLLNEPFTNPRILKVLHGSDSDIQWLQRDWGVHIVNMFDTFHAMRRLEMSKFSLQFLVNKYCDVLLDKQMQLSDWRIRPLTEAQKSYARQDTHYLLYCSDELREALLEKGNEQKNLLNAVYNDSRLICLTEFHKPQFDPLGYENLLGSRRNLNSQQTYALAELWKWRDDMARKEDEGLQFVLPNHMMLHIAEALPREMQGIIACCSPVPVMVKEFLLDLHKIVYAARDQPLVNYTIQKAARGLEKSILESIIDEQNRMTKVKAMLRSKLDFSHSLFNEEIGTRMAKEGDHEPVPMKEDSDTFLGVLGDARDGFGAVVVSVEKEPELEKLAIIEKQLEQWPTPFEMYTIAVKKAAEQELIRAAEEKKRREAAGEGPKTTFTHHDPSICRKPVFDETKVNENDVKLADCAADASRFTDDQILTKQALKRKHKFARQGASISTKVGAAASSEGEECSYTKKVKSDETVQSEETEEGEISSDGEGAEDGNVKVEPVDYSQYDKDMFKQKPKFGVDGFDPFHQKFRVQSKKNQRKRARGGHHRMGTQSVGFNPDKQKK